MLKITATKLLIAVAVIVALIVVEPVIVTSQIVQTSAQLNMLIQDLLRAESSGAKPDELRELLDQANSIIDLQSELQSNPQGVRNQSQIIQEISQRLVNVDAQTNRLEAIAAHRTLINRVVLFSLGVIGAALATLLVHLTLVFKGKYRAKRAWQMHITPRNTELRAGKKQEK